MRNGFFIALEEWTVLESVCSATSEIEPQALEALSAKELEILAFRPETKAGALAQLRFCATFLERNGERGSLAAGAIRSAANVLGWAET
jgi:hypothetical protein